MNTTTALSLENKCSIYKKKKMKSHLLDYNGQKCTILYAKDMKHKFNLI